MIAADVLRSRSLSSLIPEDEHLPSRDRHSRSEPSAAFARSASEVLQLVNKTKAPALSDRSLRSGDKSGQETASETGGAVVRVKVHVKVARIGQEFCQRLRVISEVRVGHERRFLSKLKVFLREVQVLADR